jgi:hypothetical protein
MKSRASRPFAAVASFLAVAGLIAPDSTGRAAGRPPSQSKCLPGQCRIELIPVVSLSERGQLTLSDASVSVAQDKAGRFMTLNRTRDTIVVFDRNGRFESTVGGRGRGSGQFERITHFVRMPDGAVAAYDGILRQLVAIGPSLELRSPLTLPYSPTFVRADGTFIAAQQVPDRDLVGHPIHLVGADGRVLRSFGADPPEYRQDLPLATTRLAAPAADGTVWTVAPGRYVIERWHSGTGKRLSSLAIRSPWFKESVRQPAGERPNPTIQSLWESDGYLWILLRDADANWKPAAASAGDRPYAADVNDRTYDWVLEAIDPTTGAVLSTRRFPSALWARSPDALLTTREAKAGVSTIHVWRSRLTTGKE